MNVKVRLVARRMLETALARRGGVGGVADPVDVVDSSAALLWILVRLPHSLRATERGL